MRGDESKAIGSVETDLRIIKKNLDRLFKRLNPDNAKNLTPDIAFTLSTASKMLEDAIATLDRLGNQFDRWHSELIEALKREDRTDGHKKRHKRPLDGRSYLNAWIYTLIEIYHPGRPWGHKQAYICKPFTDRSICPTWTAEGMNPLKSYQNLTSSNYHLILASGIERGRGSRLRVLPLGREVLTKLERLPFLSIGNLLLAVQLQPLPQSPSGSCFWNLTGEGMMFEGEGSEFNFGQVSEVKFLEMAASDTPISLAISLWVFPCSFNSWIFSTSSLESLFCFRLSGFHL